MLSQCFSYYCCMESLGKLPPKRFGHHMVNVSAILRILFWGCQSRGVNLGRGGGSGCFARLGTEDASTQGERQRRQRVFVDSSQFFLLCGGFAETRCFCCRGLPTSVLTRPRGTNARGAGPGCGGRRQHTEGSLQRRTTDRPPSSPEQRTRESLAERRLRTLWRPVEPAEVPASPHQSQRATAGGAVWASSADAARLRRRGSGCSAARRSQGAPPAARAQGLAAGICRLLF